MSGLVGTCLVGARDQATVIAGPLFDVLALPDLAHVEFDFGRGPVVALDELLYSLPAYAAEHAADLRRPDKVMHGQDHSLNASSHLTMGQQYGRLVT